MVFIKGGGGGFSIFVAGGGVIVVAYGLGGAAVGVAENDVYHIVVLVIE